ncbi:MAG: hypothetical protein ACO1OB_16525 [Archangium sp.]
MTTVLFIHGLESGPRGHKARALAEAGFDVVAVQMPSSRSAMLKDPLTQLSLTSALVVLISSAFAGFVWCAATLVLLALSFRPWRAAVTRRMWRRSLDVQREALKTNAIDVVLGSSFGGAVALELLAGGDWKGRTVLLCPAHRLVAQRANITAPSLPQEADVLIVHGTRDETVPLQHSRDLGGRLVEVDDTHRLIDTATPENLKAWINAR